MLKIEVPFPSDLAPFKVVARDSTGKGRIVDSAQTYERAESLMNDYRRRQAAESYHARKRAANSNGLLGFGC